jgi:exosome complex RNA-binding protein Rrp42 (RNase PH superfamily)
VQLGQTIASAEALCSVSSPASDRPLEGLLTIAVEISTAAFGFELSNTLRQQNNTNITSSSVGGVSGGGGGGGGGGIRNDPRAITITRILERQLRDARAVDLETLCIEPGKKVWKISILVTVIDASGGNLIDCCALAVAGALLHARRADVSLRDDTINEEDEEIENENIINMETMNTTSTNIYAHIDTTEMKRSTKSSPPPPSSSSSSSSSSTLLFNATHKALQSSVIIHSYTSRAPLPLAMLHIPVCVSFALFSPALLQSALTSSSSTTSTTTTTTTSAQHNQSSSSSSSSSRSALFEIAIVDPSLSESLDCDGDLTFCVNSHRELCGMQKAGGCPVDTSTLLECANIAVDQGARLVEMLKAALIIAESKLESGLKYTSQDTNDLIKVNVKDMEDDDDSDDNDDDIEEGINQDEEEDKQLNEKNELFILPRRPQKVISQVSQFKQKRSVAVILENALSYSKLD